MRSALGKRCDRPTTAVADVPDAPVPLTPSTIRLPPVVPSSRDRVTSRRCNIWRLSLFLFGQTLAHFQSIPEQKRHPVRRFSLYFSAFKEAHADRILGNLQCIVFT